MKARLIPFIFLLILSLTGCGGGGGSGSKGAGPTPGGTPGGTPGDTPGDTPTEPELVSISIIAESLNPTDARDGGTKVGETMPLPLHVAESFKAIGEFSDGTSLDVTKEALWSSTEGTTGRLILLSESRFRGEVAGAAEVLAEYQGVVGRGPVDVFRPDSVAINITSPPGALTPGMESRCTATGDFFRGTSKLSLDITAQVDWTSSVPAIVEVSNAEEAKGTVKGVNYGVSEISARAPYGETAVAIQVGTLERIEIVMPPMPMHPNLLAPFTATGTWTGGYSRDLTEEVTWRVSDTSIAEVSNQPGSKGVVTLKTPNHERFDITATYGDVTGEDFFYVTGAKPVELRVQPVNAYGPVDLYFTYTVDCRFDDGSVVDISQLAAWKVTKVSEPEMISLNITDRKGFLITRKPGVAEVTAEWQGLSNTTTVTVLDQVPLELHMWYPSYQEWLQYPLPETCDGDWCKEGVLIDSSSEEYVYRVYKLRVNEGPLTVKNLSATDLDGEVSARFQGLTEGQVLAPGEYIFDIRCDHPAPGSTSRVQWSFAVEGGTTFPISGQQFLITGEINTRP